MPHTVFLVRSARRELERLPAKLHDSVVERLRALEDAPRPYGAEKLQGRDEYKLRVGDLRIIYGIDDANAEIVVYMINDRKQVYRRLRRL